MNAEISLGTVTNVSEAVQWLSYSYLYVRMRKNPLVYGMKYQDVKGRILCGNLFIDLCNVYLYRAPIRAGSTGGMPPINFSQWVAATRQF